MTASLGRGFQVVKLKLEYRAGLGASLYSLSHTGCPPPRGLTSVADVTLDHAHIRAYRAPVANRSSPARYSSLLQRTPMFLPAARPRTRAAVLICHWKGPDLAGLGL